MIGKVVLSVVDSLICVVLNVGEKHMLYREPVGAAECRVYNVISEVSHKSRSL
jgi:hypothetical protein